MLLDLIRSLERKKEWLGSRMAALVESVWGKTKPRGPRYGYPRLEILEDRTAPAVFTVTQATDDGTGKAGTLSAAINGANANPNSTIDFNVNNAQGTAVTINVTGALPAITQPTLINGLSQGGINPGWKPWVELNGGLATNGDGLTVDSGGVGISGLAIDGFVGNGITLNNPKNSPGDVVSGDYIGCGLNGDTANVGNTEAGILVEGAANTIGGPTSLPGANVISGNRGPGIDIKGGGLGGNLAVRNVIQNNFIGVDASGLSLLPPDPLGLPRQTIGVLIESNQNGNTIGGTGYMTGNVISGDGTAGVSPSGGIVIMSSNNVVAQNDIGVGVDGITVLPNQGNGVTLITGATGNTIGTTALSVANVISGNTGDGVSMTGSNVTGNVIVGDYIGLTSNVNMSAGNGGNGVSINDGAFGNTVGAAKGGQDNEIVNNGQNGVLIDATSLQNLVAGNNIGTTGSVGSFGNTLDGVLVQGNNNTIGGAATTGFWSNLISGNGTNGIELDGNSNVALGDWIGTDSTGKAKLGNTNDGVLVQGSNNTIGGNAPAGGFSNLISGNVGPGVVISTAAQSNQVAGNFVGTDVTGSVALGNGGNGISVYGNNNTIGAVTLPATGPVNVISGNTSNGIYLTGSNNLINGDYIGTDVAGAKPVGNGKAGIFLDAASNNTIGLPNSGNPSNVISANGTVYATWGFGILFGLGSSGNLVQGSYIGTDVTGLNPLGNMADGIYFQGGTNNSTNNVIGGAAAGAGNVISANGNSSATGYGVRIALGITGNTIQNNIIGLNKKGADPNSNMWNFSGAYEDDNPDGSNQWIGNQVQS
jgi:hypothetical protein